MKKTLYILITVFSAHFSLFAQFDTQLSNYWAANNYYNPGFNGQTGNLELMALSRMQWLGIQGAPRTVIVMAEMPYSFFGREHGVGASMYNESIGLFSSSVISGQYTYKTRLFKGNFGIGIQVGYINETFDGSKVEIPKENDFFDPNDEANPGSQVTGTSIDAGLGIYFSKKNFYAGLSVTHLLSPKLELNSDYVLEIPRTYYLTAGYNIQLNNPLLELRPSILVKTVELSSFYVQGDSLLVPVEKGNMIKGLLAQTQVDISLRMIYNKTFWGGVSWRKNDAVVIMLGGKFKMIEAGYSYDYPVSRIIKGTWGSHEIFLKYVVDLSKKKSVKKYKSVRIL
ncbi:MAG: type IX secretion system membrane protein PorP/SprF [Dysgonamonadaceae bacterium]|jgi:type IX secretion system PorP/SprF family membrane protein|nr:type IX secretion system membrane protein PorP/SprF [Dysgonamonadaceae bacterium]